MRIFSAFVIVSILSGGARVGLGRDQGPELPLSLEQVPIDGSQETQAAELSLRPPENMVPPPYLTWDVDESFPRPMTAFSSRGFWQEAGAAPVLMAFLELTMTDSDALLQAGEAIDPQSVEWPLGTLTSVHFRPTLDSGIGTWVPFFSVLQDVDELDAHERDGVGAGLTYRFDASWRFDLEAGISIPPAIPTRRCPRNTG